MTFSSGFFNDAWYKWDDGKVHDPTAGQLRRSIFPLMKCNSFIKVLMKQILENYPHVQAAGSEYSPQGLEFARKRLPNVGCIRLLSFLIKLDQLLICGSISPKGKPLVLTSGFFPAIY